MEILYMVIALHAENQQAFTAELMLLFPFATIEFVDYEGENLLFLSVDVDEIGWTGFDVSVLFLDDKIAEFSRKHPYLKVGVINKIGQFPTFFYDGYIIKNKQVVFEYAGVDRGYIPLVQQLSLREVGGQDVFFDSIFTRR